MKSTGVVRRIDDLGRIVIPKEIRRNLKIREGDSLEIYVEQNEIILKKFAIINHLVETSNQLVITASNLLKKNILITNNEKIIACNKALENSYLNQYLHTSILSKLENRTDFYQDTVTETSFTEYNNAECYYYLSPIIANSDIIGSVIVFDEEEIVESDILVVKMLSSFLSKNVEE